jgi:hypothetical protein
MFLDKNKEEVNNGDFVKYKGKIYKLESQMGTHINLRGIKSGILLSVRYDEVEKTRLPEVSPEDKLKMDLEEIAKAAKGEE